jgi:hypothetical protein
MFQIVLNTVLRTATSSIVRTATKELSRLGVSSVSDLKEEMRRAYWEGYDEAFNAKKC